MLAGHHWRETGREQRTCGDGYRETKASWLELLLGLKKRGLRARPRLAVGDGAMGFWAPLEEVFSEHTWPALLVP